MSITDSFDNLKNRKPGILDQENSFISAVLVPLVNYQGQQCVLFEKRASDMNKQPGEICFPGGSVETSDENEAAAAVRETCEELGLSADAITLIAALDILVLPFNLIIYPYLCTIGDCSNIAPNPDEVDSLIYVPLQDLQSMTPIQTKIKLSPVMPEDYPYELIPNGKNYAWKPAYYPQYFYIWQGEAIWGITARILNHVLRLIS